MARFFQFPRVFQETIETLRARVNGDTNAGIQPSDSAYLDLTPGGFVYDVTQAVLLALERSYDSQLEIVAASFPSEAWGRYLDLHGVTLNVPRKDSSAATGTVTFVGVDGALVATGTRVTTVQTDPDSEPVGFHTVAAGIISGGSVDLGVVADRNGVQGNVATGAISLLDSPVDEVTSVTNPSPTTGGADVESDASYSARLLRAYQGAFGGGTIDDYIQWATAYPGVGYATVEPLWAGPGTVRVIITDAHNRPNGSPTITGLQAQLDPVVQHGAGYAPIGAAVTVATPALLNVLVVAGITPLSGYSLDGTGGTIAIRGNIETALNEYVLSLAPGDDVIYEHAKSRFFEVDGVYDVSGFTLNGGTANVAVGPLQIAAIPAGGITLT